MADIQDKLDTIRAAVNGEEVRGTIADALEAMNEQAESAEQWATGAGTEEPGGGDVPGTENNAKYYADTAATVLGQIPSDFANTATFAAGIMKKSDPITYTIITKKGFRPNDGTPEITSSASIDIAVVPVEPGKTYLFSQGLKVPSIYGAGWMASVHTLSTFDAADCVGVFFNSSASAADPHIFTAPENAHYCWYTILLANVSTFEVREVYVSTSALSPDYAETNAELQAQVQWQGDRVENEILSHGADIAETVTSKGFQVVDDTTLNYKKATSLNAVFLDVIPGHAYEFSHGCANPTSYGGGWAESRSAQGYISTFYSDFTKPRIMVAPPGAYFCAFTYAKIYADDFTVRDVSINPALETTRNAKNIKGLNTINVDAIAPPSAGYHTIETALAEIPDDAISLGTVLVFRESVYQIAYYQLIGINNATYDGTTYYYKRNPNNWAKINYDKLKNYQFGTLNRLANPEFTDAAAQSISSEHVFASDDGLSVRYRIPAVVYCNDGTVIAACEDRNVSNGSDHGEYSIVMRKKPANGEWGSYETFLPYSASGRGYYLCSCFLTDRNGTNSGTAGRVYFFCASFKDPTKRWSEQASVSDVDFLMTFTDDNGGTWSEIQSLKSLWDTTKYDVAVPAPSSGIVLPNGTFVVPCFCHDGSYSRPLLLIKPVGGDWYFTEPAPNWAKANVDENAIYWKDGLVHMLARNNIDMDGLDPATSTGVNRGMFHYTYDIAGEKWTTGHSTYEQNEGCALCIVSATINSKEIFLMSGLDVTTPERKKITLWASLDGERWMRIYRIQTILSAGYSYLSWYDGHLVTLYESRKPGTVNENNNRISYQDLTPIVSKIGSDVGKYLNGNVSIQDLLQALINKINGVT